MVTSESYYCEKYKLPFSYRCDSDTCDDLWRHSDVTLTGYFISGFIENYK